MAVWERAGKARGALSVPCQGPSPDSFPAVTCPSASFSLPQSLASPSAHPSGRSLVPAPLLNFHSPPLVAPASFFPK